MSGFFGCNAIKKVLLLWSATETMVCRGLAQFGSALGLGPRGRGFKSLNPDQFKCIMCWRSSVGRAADL